MTVSPGSNIVASPNSGEDEDASMVPTQSLRLANEVSEIRRLASAVEAFAARHGVPPKAAHHIVLAADELITNAIEHGGAPARHRIMVTLRREPTRLVLEIAHRGTAFDPTVEVPPPDIDADLDDRMVGGLGVHFAKTLLDDVSYVRRRGVNRLTLTKNL